MLDALAHSARIPRYVAAQLGATHIISGAVQWEKNAQGAVRVRVVPELIEIVNGHETVKTGEAIEDKLDDLFSTQARVSSQIAGSLGVRVSAEEATRLERQVTRNFPSAVSHALTAVQLAPGNAEYMHFAAAAMLNNDRVDSDLAT